MPHMGPLAAEPAAGDWVSRVERVLTDAHANGRSHLYEPEVYAVLAELGLSSPIHLVVRDESEVTPGLLGLIPTERVVVKAISPQVQHKQRSGYVRVAVKDLDFVRYVVASMLASLRARKLEVEGVLLAEEVDYTPELGNEILLGFRVSVAFGPVLSFSKGGSDAEHFAANFSPPNLILVPIDREWALALQSSTHIHAKYMAEGHEEYVNRIVEAEVKLSQLAVAFSSFHPGPTRFCFTELEVNPFVFDRRGRLMALDGLASFGPRAEPPDLRVQGSDTLRPLFEPCGVAVIGVSATDPTRSGNTIVTNLCRLGRKDVHCVNTKGGSVRIADRVFPLHRRVTDIPERVDLAVVTVPAASALDVVTDCAAKGVRGVLLISGGFSETTGDRAPEEKIREICRSHGIRVVGPNCLGVVYAAENDQPGVNTFFIPEEKFRVGEGRERNVAILSQSGAMGIMEIYNLRNAISPKVIVSYGNQLDVDPADLVRYFDDDPKVEVMGLYIEGFRPGAGRRFFDVCRETHKPIVVYKAGRTPEGGMATQSHTASIAGEYVVAKAALKQAGLVVAESMIDHGDYLKTFALLNDIRVTGRRVAVIANAGYEKTAAADNLGELELARLDGPTLAALEAVVPPYVRAEPLLDLTAMVSDELFARCVDILLGCTAVDALCISIVPQAQVLHTTDDEIEGYGDNIASRIVQTVQRHGKPTVVSVNVVSGADAVYNRFGQVLDRGGVPTYLTAERAMACLNVFVRYRLVRERGLRAELLREP